MLLGLGTTQLTRSRTFDEAGRLVAVSGSGIQGSATATYSSDTGRKIEDVFVIDYANRSVGGTYEYDEEGRLTRETAGGTARSYAYDDAGNVATATVGSTTTEYRYDVASRLVSSGLGSMDAKTYLWDPALGRRTSQGAPTNTDFERFTYTGSGRLATYYREAGPLGGVLSASYEYDASGQRTRSIVTSGMVVTTTAYVYEGLSLLSLAATQTASGSQPSTTTWSIDYLYDAESRPYAAVYREGATTKSFAIVTTARGDVVELLDPDGRPFAAYAYDAWGNPTYSSGSATGTITTSALASSIASRQPLRYAGYVFDAESSMYYCSARTYDPATRQFLSKDPANADGEESAYQYCVGNPVRSVDPSGLEQRGNGIDGYPYTKRETRWLKSTWQWTKYKKSDTKIYESFGGSGWAFNFGPFSSSFGGGTYATNQKASHHFWFSEVWQYKTKCKRDNTYANGRRIKVGRWRSIPGTRKRINTRWAFKVKRYEYESPRRLAWTQFGIFTGSREMVIQTYADLAGAKLLEYPLRPPWYIFGDNGYKGGFLTWGSSDLRRR